MEEALRVDQDTREGVPILIATGEVDLATAPLLEERLHGLLDSSRPVFVLDLRGVSFLDSTGLSVLMRALSRCRESGGQLHLVIDQERIVKLFTLTGLEKMFPIWPSTESALLGVAAGGEQTGLH